MVDERNLYVAVGGGQAKDYITQRNFIGMYAADITSQIRVKQNEQRTIDFYNYDVHVAKYHMFVVMPCDLQDDVGNSDLTDYDKLRLSVINLS